MQLAPSFTVVVGPNGTGKSNLADAVRWALSTGRLADGRAERREQVLFAGTPTRRPSGLCEVRLTFDNQDRTLPVDAAEVEVARRVYRGGETEYRLQGVVCRARDVERLFAHLGLAEGYAWIGQGRVEEIVSQDPAARRRLLEDAAGASVYRERRREAVQELARADQDAEVERARLEELESQLPDLRRDARRAGDAAELRRRISDLEIGLGRRRLERLGQQLQRARERAKAADESRRSGGSALGRYEELSRDLSAALSTLTDRLGGLDQRSAAVEGRLQAASARAAAATERERSALVRHGEAQERLRLAREERDALQSQFADASLQRAQAEAELRAAGAEGADAARALARMPQIESALEANARDAAAISRDLPTLQEERARCEQEAGQAADALNEAQADEERSHEALRKARQREHVARERFDAAERTASVMQDALRAAERQAPQAVRAVLREAEAGRLPGILGTLGRLVQAKEDGHRLALATALGGGASDVVVESEEVARQAIDWLRRSNAGRATFLPLGALSPGQDAKAPQVAGCLGVLSDLCEFTPELRDAVRLRLGRTLVAKDLETAQRVAETVGRRLRVVSLDGQVVQVGGALTGGQSVGVAPQAPSQAKWRTAQAELAESESALKVAIEALSQAMAAERGAAARREDMLRALERAAGAAQAARQQHERPQADLEALGAERERLLEELAQVRKTAPTEHAKRAQDAGLRQAVAIEETRRLEGELERSVQAISELEGAASAAERALAEARFEVEESRRRREAAARWRDALARERRRAQRLESALRAEERLLERAMRQVGASFAGAEEQIVRLREEAERLQAEIAEQERALKDAHGDDAFLREVPALPGQAEESLQRARRRLQELGGAPPDAPERLKEGEQRLFGLQERLADLSAAKAALVEVLAQADKSVAERLQHAVAVVGQRFGEMAEDLYGPDAKAQLVAAPQGIDIAVQLPGKESVRLGWLSGGERALAALAFLFALAGLRPPPFYLLDEVEASLDERNVERFAQFLRRQTGRQLIVVTHQRPTMEAADQLIGTTMQEKGITRLAAVQLEGEPGDGLGQVAHGS